MRYLRKRGKRNYAERKRGIRYGSVYRKLLEECSQGCKMAINSINQIQEHIENDRLLM